MPHHHHSHLLTTPPTTTTTNGNNNDINVNGGADIDAVVDNINANADDDDSALDRLTKNIDKNFVVLSANDIAESKHCASEILRKKYKNEYKKRRKLNDSRSADEINVNDDDAGSKKHKRNKRWLPDEVC